MSRLFDKVDDIINTSSTFGSMASGPFSYVAWLRPVSAGENNLGYAIARIGGTNNIAFEFSSSTAFGLSIVRSGGVMIHDTVEYTLNKWDHWCVTWDGTLAAANILIYKNGFEVGYATTQDSSGTHSSSGGTFQIGNRSSDTARTWDGHINHVHIYNRVLTPAEAKVLMLYPGSIKHGLQCYMSLNGGALRELDYSGFGRHGIVTGALQKHEDPLVTPFLFPQRYIIPKRNFFKRNSRFISATAALTGTVTSANEADIVAGGKTIILTLTQDTWVASGATFNAERQAIINGLDSAQSELLGWDNVVKALQGVAGVVRTSDTVVTITLDAQITYSITANETITATIPASALTGNVAVVATPTFTITEGTGVAGWGGLLSYRRNRLVYA